MVLYVGKIMKTTDAEDINQDVADLLIKYFIKGIPVAEVLKQIETSAGGFVELHEARPIELMLTTIANCTPRPR